MPQPVLVTERMLLVPLADRHLDLEYQLGAGAGTGGVQREAQLLASVG